MKKEGLDLKQSKANPCLFYEGGDDKRLKGVIVVYVDECVLVGEKEFIERVKAKLKTKFGVVENRKLRKLLGVRYSWYGLDSKILMVWLGQYREYKVAIKHE